MSEVGPPEENLGPDVRREESFAYWKLITALLSQDHDWYARLYQEGRKLTDGS